MCFLCCDAQTESQNTNHKNKPFANHCEKPYSSFFFLPEGPLCPEAAFEVFPEDGLEDFSAVLFFRVDDAEETFFSLAVLAVPEAFFCVLADFETEESADPVC